MCEADFQRFYGLDLRVEAEEAGLRRLWALVRGLPAEAAIWREEDNGWSNTDELLAALIEVTDLWSRLHALGQGWKKNNLPKPVQIPRPEQPPEQEPKKKPTSDPEEILAFFGKHFGQTA